jgi:hypothetical protein
MDVVTVESCLIIKTYGLSCMEFYDEIIKKSLVSEERRQHAKIHIAVEDKA